MRLLCIVAMEISYVLDCGGGRSLHVGHCSIPMRPRLSWSVRGGDKLSQEGDTTAKVKKTMRANYPSQFKDVIVYTALVNPCVHSQTLGCDV